MPANVLLLLFWRCWRGPCLRTDHLTVQPIQGKITARVQFFQHSSRVQRASPAIFPTCSETSRDKPE